MSTSKMKKTSVFADAERKQRIPAVVLLSVILPVMTFIIAPFEIYCNNIAEFTFSVREFIGVQSLFALAEAALLFALLFFLPRKGYDIAYPLLAGVLLMLFVQTNYLNGDLSSLAGDDMATKTSVPTYIWNTAAWVIVLAGCVIAFRLIKQKSIVRLGALILTIAIAATQLMNFAVLSLTTEDAYSSAVDRRFGEGTENPKFLTNKNISSIGGSRNVVVFCVDRFDSILYCDAAMKKYPEVFAKLDGFTYYSDATSLYGNTFPGVGYMLSGIDYDHEGHEEWFYRVYNENQTLSVLHELGYSINLYAEPYYDYHSVNDMPGYIENAVDANKETLTVSVRKPFGFSYALTSMSLYRSVPFLLKGLFGKVNSDTCNEYISYESDDLQGYQAFSYDMKKAYKQIRADGEFVTAGEKNFSFIHVSGCHTADYDANWKKQKGKKDYIVSARNSIEMINFYLESMKAISPELYEESTIIILGDHGKVDNIFVPFKKAMVTALFVKPSGAAGTALKTSAAPVSHDNLWATIFESEGIEYSEEQWGKSVFDIERDYEAGRPCPARRFIWNRRNLDKMSYDSIVYEITGEARNFKNWKIVKKTYHPHPIFSN
jgi:hypothetical protein